MGMVAVAPVWGQIPKGDIIIRLEPVATGLTAPVTATHAGDGSERLFIVEQSGQIKILQDGVVLAEPFLDISSKLPALNPGFDERGLLGLAFHPNYEDNGRFFVRYSAPRMGAADEPCFGTSRGCHTEVLAEYSISDNDPNLADPASEQILFMIDEPQFNHNAGEVAFGPDGFLYFSLGDGGGANDGLADMPPSHGPIGNGQNIETALGAMLRIDVDGGFPYTIPPDNPFVGTDGLDEIYAYGFRNPYRFSFDDGPGGDGALFLGDVGQLLFEEVNIVVNGGNYGWVIREGLHCFDPFNPTIPPANCPATGPLGEPLLDPIVEYSHPGSGFDPEGGITVISGFVYRGSCSPALQGRYIFGDFAQEFSSPSGRLFFLEEVSGSFEILEFQIGFGDVAYGRFLKGFGEGEDGEVYVCGSTALAPFGDTGVVERIVEVQPGEVNKFEVELSGDEEVPPVMTETTGKFEIEFNDDFTEADFELEVEDGMAITQAHLHCAPAGTNGPIVVFLFGFIPGGFDVDGELAKFTLTDANVAAVGASCVPTIGMEIENLADLAQAIQDGNIYVNVHSVANPGGEVRGQLLAEENGDCPGDGDQGHDVDRDIDEHVVDQDADRAGEAVKFKSKAGLQLR
jgi:glucose/arabinose dehydrogenase